MKIGLIGVGNMGYPLLQNLIRNKYKINALIEKNITHVLPNSQCKIFYENDSVYSHSWPQ